MSKKDPAFLFYSTAFYEGTRMMLPEERACYLDLMIYQHQNGPIPLNTSRMHMYCTGISNQVVNQVLNEKFKETELGWVSEKMCEVVDERGKSNPKKRAYATLAGLLSSNSISTKQAEKIKKEFKVDLYIDLPIDQLKIAVKGWFYSMVNGFVNNNKEKDKDKSKDKTIIKPKEEKEVFSENTIITLWPDFEDFWDEYDKKIGSKSKIEPKWEKLSQKTKEEIMAYIPNYKISQPEKKFRKNPESFFNNESWKDEIISTNGNKSYNNGQSNETDFNKVLSGIDAMYGDK